MPVPYLESPGLLKARGADRCLFQKSDDLKEWEVVPIAAERQGLNLFDI